MWSVEDFDLGPRIGAGTLGDVVLAREKACRKMVALKIVRKRRVDRLRMQRHVAREIEVHAHLCHPHISRLLGYFWDTTRIYMMLEYAPGGDLHQLLLKQPSGKFDEAVAASFVAQVVSAVAYCHRMHVIHRDIKPQNILVSSARLKVADFGWAVHTYPTERRWTVCGTIDYMPPEMVRATSGHSFGVDDWAVGTLAFELLVGQPPFLAPDREETFRRILTAPPPFTEDVSAGARGLISCLLKRDSAERMSSQVAASHPWLRQQENMGAGEFSVAFAGA